MTIESINTNAILGSDEGTVETLNDQMDALESKVDDLAGRSTPDRVSPDELADLDLEEVRSFAPADLADLGVGGEGGAPVGGTTGQLLAKASDTDGDTEWINPPSGDGIQVGDYGIGETVQLSEVADLNMATSYGLFRFEGGASNKPDGTSLGVIRVILRNVGSGTMKLIQTSYSVAGGELVKHERYQLGDDSFSEWRSLGGGGGTKLLGEALITSDTPIADEDIGAASVTLGPTASGDVIGAYTVNIGHDAGKGNSEATNVYLGSNAGLGSRNKNSVIIGSAAGANADIGWCTMIGHGAGQGNGKATVTFMGYNAGNSANASALVAFGHSAGQSSTATSGTFIGTGAGKSATGIHTTSVGNLAGQSSDQQWSVNIGYRAGILCTDGELNTNLGYGSGGYSTGSNNVNIGSWTGNGLSGDVIDLHNTVVIGSGNSEIGRLTATKSNQVVLGNANIEETILRGNVLIDQLTVNGVEITGGGTPTVDEWSIDMSDPAGQPPLISPDDTGNGTLTGTTLASMANAVAAGYGASFSVGSYFTLEFDSASPLIFMLQIRNKMINGGDGIFTEQEGLSWLSLQYQAGNLSTLPSDGTPALQWGGFAGTQVIGVESASDGIYLWVDGVRSLGSAPLGETVIAGLVINPSGGQASITLDPDAVPPVGVEAGVVSFSQAERKHPSVVFDYTVSEVVAGNQIEVDSTDPSKPVISFVPDDSLTTSFGVKLYGQEDTNENYLKSNGLNAFYNPADIHPHIESITRNSTGRYTLVMKKASMDMGITCSCDDIFREVEIRAAADASGKTVHIRIVDASNRATDVDVNAWCTLSFTGVVV